MLGIMIRTSLLSVPKLVSQLGLAFLLSMTALPFATLAAQQATTAQGPKALEPHIVIETVGPDGWRMRLGVTNVAAMLGSEEGRSIWQPRLDPLLGMWQMMVGDEQAFAAASKRIFSYGGTIRIAAYINEDAAAHVAVMLEPDGRTDMEAVAKDITGLIERGIPGEWTTRAIGGRDVKLRSKGDTITAPIVENGRLYLVAGDSNTIDKGLGLATHLMARPLTIGRPGPDSPALHMSYDIPALLALDSDDMGEISKAFGFSDIEDVTFSVKAAGPRVELDIAAHLSAPARGVVRAFAPDVQGISGLAELLPEKASAWKIGHFDGRAMFHGIVDAIVAEGWGETRKEIFADINEECGTDIDGELLANLGTEVLVLGSPLKDFDRLREATWLIGFRVKDEARFRKSFKALMTSVKGLFSGSETVDVDGVELRRYGNMVGYDLWMGVGNGLFVISAGRDSEEQATEVLKKAKGKTFAKLEQLHASHAELKRYMPKGLNGLAQLDIGSVLAIPSEWWVEPLNELVPFLGGPQLDPDEAEEQQARFHELLQANNLGLVRSATGFRDGRWHWRLFW